jgi:hypothetical protein
MSLPVPYPADTRAKGWRFELAYEQIEQSDTWGLAKPEARPWLLMLWLTAWKQVPCGSLPADHQVIAGKLGIPDDVWEKHGAVLLRGWWQAEDGRLYHNTLTTRVLEMMSKRRSDADRQALRRSRKSADEPAQIANVTRDSGVSPADVTRDSCVSPHGVTQESGVNPAPITDNRIPNTKDISNPTGSHPSADADGGQPAQVLGSNKSATVPCPYDRFVALYHEALPQLPRVMVMSPTRQKAMRKLWAWVLSSKRSTGERRAENTEQALAWLADYFARAASNDFLMGRTPRSAEHAGWQADFDFLLTERGMRHVIEKTREAA